MPTHAAPSRFSFSWTVLVLIIIAVVSVLFALKLGFELNSLHAANKALTQALTQAHGQVHTLQAQIGELHHQLAAKPRILRVPKITRVSAPAARYVIVQTGQTLSGIAATAGTTWQHLAAVNHLANPNLILTGEYIRL